MRFDLTRLFKPKSIAIVGGGVWCRSVLEQCKKMNYQGALYAVHPRADNLAGIKAVASVQDLPQPPDACFIGVNRHATVDVIAGNGRWRRRVLCLGVFRSARRGR